MPLPEEKTSTIADDKLEIKSGGSKLNTKVFIFGLPIFVVQLVAVYFITANILLNRIKGETLSKAKAGTEAAQTDTVKKETALGKFIFPIDDIIVNPADTDGKRLLLVSVGLDLGQQKMEDEVKSREPMVKDAIITALSSNTIPRLNDTAYRDTLKLQISDKLMQLMPDVKVNTVYFSKFIIQ